MKRFTLILAMFGAGSLIAGGIFTIISFDPLSVESVLSSDGVFDEPIMHGFSGLESGMIIAGLVLLLLAVIFYLCERGIIPIFTWNERRFIYTIIGLKVLLSIVYIIIAPYTPCMYDDTAYFGYGKCFANGDPILNNEGNPTAWWPIGYPLYLSIFFRIFGQHVWAGQLANMLILTGTIVMTYLLGYRMFGTKIARRATIVMTLMPSQIFYTIILLSDMLFAFLVLTLVYLVQRERRLTNTILIGVVLGIATSTRSTILLFPVIIFIYWIIKYKQVKSALLYLLIIGIVCEMVLLPWQIRNYREFGGFAMATTNGGIHLWMGNNPHASGGFIPGVFFIPDEVAFEIDNNMTEIEKDRFAYRQGFSYMLAHPLRTVALWPKKFLYLYSKESRSVTWPFAATYRQVSPPILMSMVIITEVFFVTLGLSFLAGLYFLFRKESISPRIWFLCGTILYFTAVYLMFIAEGRYHLPLIPIFALFAVISHHEAEKNTPSQQ